MTRASSHTRIIHIPDAEFLHCAILESFRIEKHGEREDLTLDILGFKPAGEPALLIEDEMLYERIEGYTRPIRLLFSGVKDLIVSGLYENLS